MKNEWTTKLLGDVATLQRGFDLPHRIRRPGQVPIVTSSGLGSTHSEARVSAPGVVTGRYGTIGEVFYVDRDFWPLNTTLYVRNFHSNNPLFVSYLLRTIDFATHSGKSGVPGVNRNDLHEIEVSVPPTLAEQEAIAEALSDADALIESLEQLIAKKRQLKQGAMQDLLTGKKRLPGFEGEWEVRDLGELFTLSAGRSKSGALDEAGTHVVMDMGSVSSSGATIPKKRTNIREDLLKIGDLVMPKDDIGGGNIIGRVAFIDNENCYVLGDHVYRLRLISDCLDAKFYYYLINGDEVNHSLRAKVAGSAQLGLGRKPVLEQKLKCPTNKPEQTAIAAILSDMDAEIAALEAKLTKARQVKQGMMQELLTGKTRLV